MLEMIKIIISSIIVLICIGGYIPTILVLNFIVSPLVKLFGFISFKSNSLSKTD